jgi:hypothetical protein
MVEEIAWHWTDFHHVAGHGGMELAEVQIVTSVDRRILPAMIVDTTFRWNVIKILLRAWNYTSGITR